MLYLKDIRDLHSTLSSSDEAPGAQGARIFSKTTQYISADLGRESSGLTMPWAELFS